MNKNKLIMAVFIIVILLAVWLLLGREDSPYDRYLAALEKLQQAQSFRSEYSEINEFFFDGKAAEKTVAEIGIVAEYCINEGKPEAIITMTIDDMEAMKRYMRGGYSYGDDYREAIPDEAILQAALNLVFDFPEDVIAEQSESEVSEGKELQFILDGEKYYEYLNSKYSYSGDTSYNFSPAPKFTMFVDRVGILRSISGEISRQSLNQKYPHDNLNFSLSYENINGYDSLDFSALDETKYKDLPQ